MKWGDAFLMEMYARKALRGPYLPISRILASYNLQRAFLSIIKGKHIRIKYKFILYFNYIF